MTRAKAVLWDMDGILVDTGAGHFEAWSRILAELHIPFSDDLFRQTFGMNNTSILTLLTGKTPDPTFIAEISERKEIYFRDAIRGKVQPLPGVLHWLAQLEAHSIAQALASSAPQENIDALVDELDIRSRFQTISSGARLAGKPAPDVFLHAARALKVSPADCIVIEDSIPGVEAARRAGMTCIAVTNTNPRAVLSSARTIVDSLEELTLTDFEL